MTQLGRLVEHLSEGKSITPLEAKEVYGITRLAARIHEARSYLNYPGLIARELRTDEAGKRYTRYWAASPKARKYLRELASAL